jgi:hypothetical protein
VLASLTASFMIWAAGSQVCIHNTLFGGVLSFFM